MYVMSNEGSNFILSLLKLVIELLKHLKLQVLAIYNNLRMGQDSEFAKFWPKALIM